MEMISLLRIDEDGRQSTFEVSTDQFDDYTEVQQWVGGRFTGVVVNYQGTQRLAYIREFLEVTEEGEVVRVRADAKHNPQASLLAGKVIRGVILIDLTHDISKTAKVYNLPFVGGYLRVCALSRDEAVAKFQRYVASYNAQHPAISVDMNDIEETAFPPSDDDQWFEGDEVQGHHDNPAMGCEWVDLYRGDDARLFVPLHQAQLKEAIMREKAAADHEAAEKSARTDQDGGG